MKLSNRGISLGIILSSFTIFPIVAQAQDVNELIIVNHFDKSLTYFVGRNPDVLPDLSEKFTLAPGNQVTSKVLDLKKEAYIRAEDNNEHSAFWGVEVENNHTKIHGYLSHGIAYSWNTQTVVFCTPEEYKKKNSCL